SGAVALALAHERPRALVIGTDISVPALALARESSERLAIGNVQWLQSDWYAQLPPDAEPFDVIVSNPPYVQQGDAHLQQGDLRFEPLQALTAGVDALLALRRVIDGAKSRLREGGCLAVEHGYDQADRVRTLLESAGFAEVRDARDLAGIPRVSYGRFEPSRLRAEAL
ncbi:MAG: peptide chain release factor N(5)-glutamine methyltransferase, partial [Pseudomonadota bacterium]|nr:peptide chain release factor N(5)-glutamine methyltransferase [Pseudomonadota bacterium]